MASNARPDYSQQYPPAGAPAAGTQGAGLPPDQLAQAQQQVADVKVIMTQNVQRIIDRGETLESLDQRANALTANADEFRNTSRTLRKKMWWKNTKMMLILAVIVLVIIAIIISVSVAESSGGGGGDSPANSTLAAS